jgi:ATP-dependent Clp protease protease subunit
LDRLGHVFGVDATHPEAQAVTGMLGDEPYGQGLDPPAVRGRRSGHRPEEPGMNVPTPFGAANPGAGAPTGRYIVPQFEERTAYGYKRNDPYNKLFEDRIIFLGAPVDDTSADDIMAQLIVLESSDPDRDIIMYINSPGGSFTALTAIYDTMQYIKPDIQTVCLGQAASAAAVLLAAGTKGKRLALPNARVLIHQPALVGGDYGQASDIEIQANEVLRMRAWLEETISRHSTRSVEQVRLDIERDKILTAEQAVEYGLVDQVLGSRKTSTPAYGTDA